MKNALALVAAVALAGTLAAPATAEPAAPAQTCPVVFGFVCLARSIGFAELIPQGEARRYPNGLPVTGITNGTTLTYCVVASPISFGVGPGQVSTLSVTVRSVAPNQGACLL